MSDLEKAEWFLQVLDLSIIDRMEKVRLRDEDSLDDQHLMSIAMKTLNMLSDKAKVFLLQEVRSRIKQLEMIK